MKLLKLFIKNINSLQGEFEIDFTDSRFSENPVFAIVGEIGAGKSSILDCICLGLYQRTPRVDSVAHTALNSGALVSIGTEDAYAKVEFENNGNVFRSTWSAGAVSRGDNKGSFNSGAISVLLEKREAGVFKAIEGSDKKAKHKDLINEVVGLGFDQFSKTILLAQGSFAELLRAKESERTEIIEQLTGTSHYKEIGKAVYAFERQLKQEISELETRLDGFKQSLLTEEQLAEKNQVVEAIGQDLLEKRKQFAELEKLSALITKHTELRKKFSEAQNQEQKLLAKEAVIKEKRELENRHNLAKELEPLVKTAEDQKLWLEKNQESLHKSLNAREAFEKDLKSTHEQLKTSFPKLKNSADIKSDCEQITEELNRLFQGKNDASVVFRNEEKREQELKLRLRKSEQAIEKAKSRLKTLNTELSGSQKFLEDNPTSEELITNLISDWEEANKQYELKISKYQGVGGSGRDSKDILEVVDDFSDDIIAERDKIVDRLNTAKAKKQTEIALWEKDEKTFAEIIILQKTAYSKQLELSKLKLAKDKQLEEKEKKGFEIEMLKAKQKVLAEKFGHLFNENSQIEVLRSDLQEGKECPVCGSEHHPFAKKENAVLLELGKAKIEEQGIEEQLKRIEKSFQDIDKELGVIDANVVSTQRQINELEESQKNKQKELTKVDFSKDLSEKDLLERKQAAVLQLSFDIKEAEFQQERLKMAVDQRLLKAKEVQQASVNEVIKRIKPLNAFSSLSVIDFVDLQKFRKELSDAASKVKETKGLIAAQNETIDGLRKEEDELKKELAIQSKLVENSKMRLTEVLEQIQACTSVEKPIEFVNQIKISAEKLGNEMTIAKERCRVLKEQIEEKQKEATSHDKKLFQALQGSVFNSEIEVKEALMDKDKLEVIKTEIKQYENDCIQVKSIISEIQKALTELEKVSEEDWERKDQMVQEIGLRKAEIDQLIEKKGAIDQELRKHNETIAAISEEAATIQAKKEAHIPYDLLNRAIGSATGDKFAKVAARYTFNKLLEFTNYHLTSLKSRYAFKPLKALSDSDEDLVVIDREMANAERLAKNTLSGGETFLTSLCLALALSDLSSQKVNLGNLFIDEGFGSLDPNACEEALTLLENLPDTTNKTVGIISHVGAIKERISNQILVEKLGTGRSKIILN